LLDSSILELSFSPSAFFLELAVFVSHETIAMHFSTFPPTFVIALIWVSEFTRSMLVSFLVLSFVLVTVLPLEFASSVEKTLFPIALVLAVVRVGHGAKAIRKEGAAIKLTSVKFAINIINCWWFFLLFREASCEFFFFSFGVKDS